MKKNLRSNNEKSLKLGEKTRKKTIDSLLLKFNKKPLNITKIGEKNRNL